MNNEYLDYRERFETFNRWEEQQKAKSGPQENLQRFLILYDLHHYLPAETIQQARREHLENLIEMQKRIFKMKDAPIKTLTSCQQIGIKSSMI